MNITDKTNIQLWAVLSSVPFIVGGVVWLTTIYAETAEATRINIKQDITLDRQMNLLLEVRERLIRIETKLPKRGE